MQTSGERSSMDELNSLARGSRCESGPFWRRVAEWKMGDSESEMEDRINITPPRSIPDDRSESSLRPLKAGGGDSGECSLDELS